MQLTRQEQEKGMRHAIYCSCSCTLAEVLLNNSSVIILYATILGASSMLSLVTTSLMNLSVCFFMIPFAYIISFLGSKRKIIAFASSFSFLMITLAAAAPFFGKYSREVLLTSLASYSLFYSLYIAAWFPLLEGVVPLDTRGRFFGKMRFAWQSFTAMFFFIVACFIGKDSSVESLQIVVFICALGQLGQAWHIMKMPELPTETIKNLKASLIDIIGNGKLAGFSVYLFFLYAASGSTLPTIFIFAKDSLNTPDNIVVVISTLALVGMLAGYLAGGLFVDRCGVKTIFLSAHIAFGILNIAMLCVASSSLSAIIFICTLVTIYGFLLACASIAVSSEMMALAPQNNKAMSMAFCFSLYSAGFGASRLLTSFVLGSGMLSSSWKAFGYSFTQFHSLFLFYGFAVLFACVLLVLVPAFVQGARRLPFR